MMTKGKNYSRNKFRILALVPLSALLLLVVSLLNGLFPQNVQAGNSGLKQTLILSGSAVSGSVIQDDTLKKKTFKVKVITEDQKVSKSKRVKVISDSNGKDTIIYIVDGKPQNDVTSINPDSIESVNVIADSMTFSKGKKEVVVVLKHPWKVEKEVIVEPVEGEHGVVVEPVEGEHGVIVEPVEGVHGVVVEPVNINHEQIVVEPGRVSFPDDVIYYIDGKRVSKVEVDKINPESIESVSVCKGDGVKEAGVSRKGIGVVKIVTKK